MNNEQSLKQKRTCPDCGAVTEYDGWQVDGYGFQTVICPQCSATHNYRGVIGHADKSSHGFTVHYTGREGAYVMAERMANSGRNSEDHIDECNVLWEAAIKAGMERDAEKFRELCVAGNKIVATCHGCRQEVGK